MNEVLKKYPVKHPLLKKHIKFFWEIHAEYMQLDHKLIPVRNIDLKFNLSETPHYLRMNDKSQMLDKVYFSGLQDHFRNARIFLDGRVHVLGICFFPGGFYPFLKNPVSVCKNRLLGASETGLRSINALHERLMEAQDITARLSILEQGLLSILEDDFQTPDRFRPLIISLGQSDSTASLAEFSRQNNTGMRKLERMFNKYVGVSTKTFVILNRFQNSLNQLLHSDYSKLSDIAYGNAYFDQMHFIRDFKRFAGNTPKNFTRRDNSMIHIR